MENREIDAVIDLQFGSTGKGAIAGWLARIKKYDTAVTAWMPNAGHTYIDQNGQKMVHTALANSVVSPNLRQVLIAPATVLDVDALTREIRNARELGYMSDCTVCVHENATILRDDHKSFERDNIKSIGSTQKGSGAAIIAKITRDPQAMTTAGRTYPHGMITATADGCVQVIVVSHAEYKQRLRDAKSIIMEGAQGYSLGIHSGFYPYTTSRECTVAQLCSDTLISPDAVRTVYGCARTYPIRVSNRYTDDMMHGWSGPAYSDQQETSFETLNQVQETTTVTKLPRRVFTFSEEQLAEAIEANMPSKLKVALTFCDYACAESESESNGLLNAMRRVVHDSGAKIFAHNWGASHNDLRPSHGS